VRLFAQKYQRFDNLTDLTPDSPGGVIRGACILSIPGQNFKALQFKSETEYFS